VPEAEAIENIDIGGPSMLRSAAKNFESVTVVIDPAGYDTILAELRDNGGATTLKTVALWPPRCSARRVTTTTRSGST